MSSILKFIKKREKLFLYAVLVIITLGFGISGSMIALMGDRGQDGDLAGEVFGQKISRPEFAEVRSRWISHLGWVEKRLQQYQRIYLDSVPPFDMIGFYLSPQQRVEYLNRMTWWVFILKAEADRLGITVDEQEIADYIKMQMFPDYLLPAGDFDYKRYRGWLAGELGVRDTVFEQMVGEFLIIKKCRDVVGATVLVPEEKIYEEYVREQTKIKFKYLLFDPEQYRLKVRDISSHEIVQYFENHQGKYRVDDKIRIEYLLADTDELAGEMPAPTAEKIKKYYDDNKENYKISSTGADQEPKYEPLAEVQDRIKEILTNQEASLMGRVRMEQVDKRITDLTLESKKVDFKKLAEEFKLKNRTTGLFSADRVSEISDKEVGYSRDFDDRIFDYPLNQASNLKQTSKGTLIFRVVKKKDGYVPKLTLRLKEKVRQELKERKAHGLAKAEIDKIEQEIKEGVEQKIKGSAGELTADQKGVIRDEVFMSVARSYELPVVETAYVKRSGSTNVPDVSDDVMRQAFDLEKNGDWQAVREPAKFYLIQLVNKILPWGEGFSEQRPALESAVRRQEQEKLIREWSENLWKRAGLKDKLEKSPES